MSSVTKVSNKSAQKADRRILIRKAEAAYRLGRHGYVQEMDFLTLRMLFEFTNYSASHLVEWAVNREGRKLWLKVLNGDKSSYRNVLGRIKQNRLDSQAGKSRLWAEIGGDVPFTKNDPE